jgi:hypothetical protein
LFPRQEKAGIGWGLEPIFNATPQQRAKALETGAADELQMISLSDVIGSNNHLDLLHIDIKGGEANLIRDTIPVLNEKVAYLLIGTHSREIEGQIFAELLQAGWLLEIERPAYLQLGGPPRDN